MQGEAEEAGAKGAEGALPCPPRPPAHIHLRTFTCRRTVFYHLSSCLHGLRINASFALEEKVLTTVFF